jgi:hypothetical protein
VVQAEEVHGIQVLILEPRVLELRDKDMTVVTEEQVTETLTQVEEVEVPVEKVVMQQIQNQEMVESVNRMDLQELRCIMLVEVVEVLVIMEVMVV